MRRLYGLSDRTVMGFNPRICKRCDKGIHTDRGKGCVSIHASVKDATQQVARLK